MRCEAVAPELKKAVKEYYEWNGDKSGYAMRIVISQPSELGVRSKMVLARFTDAQGFKGSSLMDFAGWADGHYDVTEVYIICRDHEKDLVKAFEASQGILGIDDDDDYDEDDDDDFE